jgi:aspartate 1-decarboxylase
MLKPFLISEIHRATVTGIESNYSGSIALDPDLMKEAGIREFQEVEIYNINSGNRFFTYVIAGEKGSRDVSVNSGAVHLATKGDKLIIAAYALLDERELDSLNSVILLMKDNNEIEKVITGRL